MPWSFEEPAKARLEVPGTAPSGGRFQSPEALEFALHSRLPLYNFRFCASGGCFPSKQVCAFEPSDPAGVRSRRGHSWEIDPQTKGGAGTGAGPGEVGWERGFPSERARPGPPPAEGPAPLSRPVSVRPELRSCASRRGGVRPAPVGLSQSRGFRRSVRPLCTHVLGFFGATSQGRYGAGPGPSCGASSEPCSLLAGRPCGHVHGTDEKTEARRGQFDSSG